MSEAVFTPGPWVAGISAVLGADLFSVVPKYETGKVVSVCGDCGTEDEEESIANAYLIAAAPDMYEALEAISGSGCFCSCSIGNPMTGSNHSDACKKAAAALKKARGEV